MVVWKGFSGTVVIVTEVDSVPPVLHVGAVHDVAAVLSGSVTCLAVVVALVAHRALAKVSVLLVVAPTVDKVINFCYSDEKT